MNNNDSSNLIKSPQFLLSIVSKIETMISRELSDGEDDLVIACIKKVPINIYESHSTNELMDIIANTVLSELQFSHRQVNEVDTHELLKKNLGTTIGDPEESDDRVKDTTQNAEVNIDSFLGTSDVATLVKKINEPNSSVNTAYFMLDTRYRILENDGTTYFKWGHINNLVRSQGTFNSVGNVRDIISIKLCQFRMPLVKSADTPYKRISILIHELCPQSFVAHEERRYHFLGNFDDHNPAPGWIEVDPGENCGGEFKFNKPVTHLDMITISLASPLEPVVFDPDRACGVITSYANPTVIEFPSNHNLLNNDIVYISQYTSVNPSMDGNILRSINISKGLVATVTTPKEITIPIDTSSFKFTLTGLVSPMVASPTLNGVGTDFIGELHTGDKIIITDGADNPSFIVKSIQSNTVLTLTTSYNGVSGVGFTVEKNNTLSDNISVYFGSKRIFFTLEATYLSS